MQFVPALVLLLIAAPALAAKKPPPPPPLPPLVLDAAAPIVTLLIDGQPLRLRVDTGVSRDVLINASAAARLGLATPGRLVGGKPVDLGTTTTQVGKVKAVETTSRELLAYHDRTIAARLAWPKIDTVAGADGLINPMLLPHDVVRSVQRPQRPDDARTVMALRWSSGRGMLGTLPTAEDDVDIVLHPAGPITIATAAAASLLAKGHDGRLTGPARTVPIMHGASRPVRDVVFARPVEVAGVKVVRAATRVFDWSGKTDIPDADLLPGEAVVKSNAGRQGQWAKLTLGHDVLADCAEITWYRAPLRVETVCPGH
jgi:hypothetical protein